MSENKKILISLPGALLDEIDSFTKNEKTNRSEFIREAIKVYIKEKKRELINEQMKNGYAEMGDINLEYAKMCFEADCAQLRGYEEKLAECE